jgi:hypothetical protein
MGARTPAEVLAILTGDEIRRAAQNIDPHLKGLYFLLRDNEIIYIGQAVNYLFRVGEHLKDKQISAYYFLPFDGSPAELTHLERAYIDKFSPAMNTQKMFWQNAAAPDGSSLIDQAIALMKSGYSGYAAAKAVGITIGALYQSKKYKDLRDSRAKHNN